MNFEKKKQKLIIVNATTKKRTNEQNSYLNIYKYIYIYIERENLISAKYN